MPLNVVAIIQHCMAIREGARNILLPQVWLLYVHLYRNKCCITRDSAEMNSDFCYSNSCFLIKYHFLSNTSGAHTRACTHTHQVVVAGGTYNLQRTFFSPPISMYSHTGLFKGLYLLELAIYDQDTWDIT